MNPFRTRIVAFLAAPVSLRSTIAAAVAGLALVPSFASADDVYYLGSSGSGNWSNPFTWNGAAVPNSGDNLIFRGALRADSYIDERRTYGNLRFIPDAGDISTSYTVFGRGHTSTVLMNDGVWDSRFESISNATKSTQRISGMVANNFRVLTVDNATTRSDAGALEFLGIALVPGNVLLPTAGTTDRDLTIAFKPGVNGIIVSQLTAIANGQRGLATIDGPGYVYVNNISNGFDYQVQRGTLSLGTTSQTASQFYGTSRITLNTGTTLDLDTDNWENSQQPWNISAPNGQAAINVDAGLSIELGSSWLSGTFAKTGAGELILNNATGVGTGLAVQSGRLVLRDPTNDCLLTDLSVASGAEILTTNSARVFTQTLTGTGSVTVDDSVLTFTPTTATQVNTRISGSGRLGVKAPGGLVDVRSINAYTGGTTVDAGTLVVSSAFGGLGSGDVTVNGGTLAGTGRVSGKVFVKRGGTIAPSRADTPGLNTGTFTVAGLDLTAGGSVGIEFNGITQGTQVDLLAVNNGGAFGDADITNGTLNLSRGTNFFPASGKFPKVSILKTGSSGSLTGVFASINGVRVNDTYSFAVTYDAQNVYAQLADVSDTNLDNAQNYLDLYALAGSYKKGTLNQTWVQGDLSGDGTVNYTDLLLVDSYVPELTKTQFDALLPQNYALWYDYGVRHNFSVPEPASLAVLSLAGVMLGRRRRA